MDTTNRLRIGIAGSGALAGIRARAIQGSGLGDVVAVGARSMEKARALADDFPTASGVDVDQLFSMDLDALVVCVPHHVQDELVPRALDSGRNVLIGGPLARTSTAGFEVIRRQQETGLVVEAGYEARYESTWRRARKYLEDGTLGEIVSVRSNAGFDQVPDGWYADHELSGGMLVTHFSYAFLNPLRWLFGEPVLRGAVGNTKRARHPRAARPETCAMVWQFPNEVAGALTASYVKPDGLDDWDVLIVGTEGALRLQPADLGGGRLELIRSGHDTVTQTSTGDGFIRQAASFLSAVGAQRTGAVVGAVPDAESLKNPPQDAIRDLVLCEIVEAALSESTTS